MLIYDVSCYHAQSGRLVWGGTWEATSPAQAIAKACLPPPEREAWAARHQGAVLELSVVHPVSGPQFDVVATLMTEVR